MFGLAIAYIILVKYTKKNMEKIIAVIVIPVLIPEPATLKNTILKTKQMLVN